MIGSTKEIICKRDSKIRVKIMPGHFAMTHSHTNCYVDVMEPKLNQKMAQEAAEVLTTLYTYQQKIDTILCLEGGEVIGAFMAKKLSEGGMFTVNDHESIYIVTLENEFTNQMIIRDNIQPMIRDKNVLVLCSSIITGKNVERAKRVIEYYGGKVCGITSIFSIPSEIAGIHVTQLFSADDIPEYQAYEFTDCALCKAGQKVDAIAKGFGYSIL